VRQSSLTDELLSASCVPPERDRVVASIPRAPFGCALLGDRIRIMPGAPSVFMRSLASAASTCNSACCAMSIELYTHAGLIWCWSRPQHSQHTEIESLADIPLYVMTSEYGAASQLEKIDMSTTPRCRAEQIRDAVLKRAADVRKHGPTPDGRRQRAESGVPTIASPLQNPV